MSDHEAVLEDVRRRHGARRTSTTTRRSSPSRRSGCSGAPGSSSPTSPRSRSPATTSCGGSSTTPSSSAATRRASCGRCSTCACTAACRSAAPRWATRRTSAARTTAGRTSNDGRLVGLPFHGEAYGGEEGFRKKGQTLLPAPSLDVYNGLIFISLDAQAPPLREYLGDFAFYLDLYTQQSPEGIELVGPQRWRVKANWKIGAENFAGDMYHTPHTHSSVVEIGLFREPKA